MSKIHFSCPQCGHPVKAEDGWIGMQAECPYCKQTIIIEKTQTVSDSVLEAAAPDEKSCPFCGQIIKKEAIFCKHCKKNLGEPKKNKVTCQYCAEEIEIQEHQQGDVICPSCGKSLSRPEDNPDPQPVSETVNPVEGEKQVSKIIKIFYNIFFWKTFLAIWITILIPVFTFFAFENWILYLIIICLSVFGSWIVYSIIVFSQKQKKYAGFVICNALLAILLAGIIYGAAEEKNSGNQQIGGSAEKKDSSDSKNEFVEVLCYLINNRNEEKIPFCDLILFDSNPQMEKCFQDALVAKKSSEKALEYSKRGHHATAEMSIQAASDSLNAALASTKAWVEFCNSLKNANAKYDVTFRTGRLQWNNIPAGEYTAYASARYGNQKFQWVKHLTVVKGKAELAFTNDATCYISEE
ncbi:MAG: zinc ribbon domain-containing protein [Lentisphaeria bacterium]|nr:zinc ribbon domain-containing protein [Lentisphaeria bacterium]